MPCNQMISMNCMPPREVAASTLARLPAANGRIRNRCIENIGSGTRVSMITKATRSATPPTSPTTTQGLVQPVAWSPYGWIP
jgi:hypothetical protein